MDVHKFVRKLSIKRYMSNRTIRSNNSVSTNILHSGLSASLFNPPGVLAPTLRVFRDVVLRDLEALEKKKSKKFKDYAGRP